MEKASQNNISGFTLIELLITMVILVILSMMTVPSLRDTLENSRIKAAAETFAQQLKLARTEAIQQQKVVYLSVVTGSQWCSGVNANSACTCSPNNNCGLDTITYSDYSDISLSTLSGFTNGIIFFDSIRGLPSSAGQMSFQKDTKVINVSINSIGLITFCSTNVPGYSTC